MAYFISPEECATYIHDLIQTNLTSLGLAQILYGDVLAQEVVKYPCCLITPGDMGTDLGATREFRNEFQVFIFIFHAKATITRKTRTQEDIQLAIGVRDLLHRHMQLKRSGDPGVVHGFVVGVAPGNTPISSMETTVSSRMLWRGTARETFPPQEA